MSGTVDAFLIAIPPLVVYLTVGLVVGIESLGVPLPGEIVLVSAALLSSRHELDVSPGWIAPGRDDRRGRRRLHRLRHRPPLRHGPVRVGRPQDAAALQCGARDRRRAALRQVGRARRVLRPVHRVAADLRRAAGRGAAHALPRFLIANVLGGICWAAGTTFAVYLLGIVAERWLQRFSWIGLVVAVIAGLTIGAVVKRRTARLVEDEG